MFRRSSKNATFSAKTVKTRLFEAMAILMGRVHLVTEISNDVLNFFH